MKRLFIIFTFIFLFNIWIYSQTFFSPGKEFLNTDLNGIADDGVPRNLFSKDLDGDGFKDIIASSDDGETIFWYKNIGGISFQSPKLIGSIDGYISDLAVGDLNSDGRADIIFSTANLEEYNSISWYENIGAGIFSARKVAVDSVGSYLIKLADLDNDGVLDLVINNSNSSIDWFKNDGFANFGNPKIIDVLTPNSNLYEFDIVDFDNDSDLDIIAQLYSNRGDLLLYVNNGIGNFTSQTINDSISYAFDANAIDFDGDGDMDVIVADYSQGSVIWFENEGNLVFGERQLIDSNFINIQYIEVADIDNDGDNDIMGNGYYNWGNTVIWFKNNGNSNFERKEIMFPENYNHDQEVLLTDVDNDGDLDVFRTQEYYYIESFMWAKNNGNDNFSIEEPLFLEIIGGIDIMKPYDVDNDGDLDIISVPYYYSKSIYFVINDGTGDFRLEDEITSAPGYIQDLEVADMDGDGDFDLILKQNSSSPNKLVWLENDGSNQFDSTHTIATDSFVVNSVVPADIDNDGDIDIMVITPVNFNLAWLENDGTGQFLNNHSIEYTNKIKAIDLADMDDDGDLDILSSNNRYLYIYNDTTYSTSYGYQLIIYKNNGDGSFNSAPGDNITDVDVRSVMAADLDADGDLDALGAFYSYGRVIWMRNNGSGALDTFNSVLYVANSPNYVTSADLDNDGDMDILAGANGNHVGWFENIGNDNFSPVQMILDNDNSNNSNRFYTVDMDVDGDIDILYNNFYYDSDHWFENLLMEELTTVQGQIYWDKNQDSVYNAGDEAFRGVAIEMQPDGYTFYTDNNGFYSSVTPLSGSHNLQLNPPYRYDCSGQVDLNLVIPETQPYTFDYQSYATVEQDFVYFGIEDNCRTISGQVFEDENQNGLKDLGEDGLSSIQVKAIGHGNSYSDINGYYDFEIPETESTELTITLNNSSNSNQCNSSTTTYTQMLPDNNEGYTIDANSGDQNSLLFGVYKEELQTFDVGLYSLVVYNGDQPGEIFYAQMDFKANGIITSTCKLRITHSPLVTLISSNIPPALQTSTFVEWSFPPGSAPNWYCMQMNWQVDENAIVGDTLHWEADYNCPPGTDGCPYNNHLDRDVVILPPNQRVEHLGFAELYSMAPQGFMPTIIKNDAFLSYEVVFQNPLETTANNVTIIDTLPASLDLTTVSRPFASYPFYDFMLSDAGVLKVTMNGIGLSDPTIDELNSYGFIQFNVKLKAGLEEGTLIPNKANVIFNGQEVMTTNEVIHQIDNSTPVINEVFAGLKLTVFPNPFNESTLLRIEGQIEKAYDLEIVDITGKVIREHANIVKNDFVISKDNLPNGIYFLNLFDSEKRDRLTSFKLVVQ